VACLTAQNFIGPSFGLPFVTGSLPHSPQMVKALTNYKQEPDGSFSATGVAENRIAPFIMCARLSSAPPDIFEAAGRTGLGMPTIG
jgi:hypothetical protein